MAARSRETEMIQTLRSQMHQWAVQRALVAEETAPNFSPFEFVRGGELGLSAVIAWILNPDGSHGQRDAYLKLFMSSFAAPYSFRSEATVETEARTSRIASNRRRHDILISSAELNISIENKPWAIWQEEQPKAYLDDLSRIGGETMLIILQIDNQPLDPSLFGGQAELEEFIKRKRVAFCNYRSLSDFLEKCITVTIPPRVADFLSDFRNYIAMSVLGERPVDETRLLAEEIMQMDGVATAMNIASAASEVRRLITSSFEDALTLAFERSGSATLSQFTLSTESACYIRGALPSDPHSSERDFCVEFFGKNLQNCSVGIALKSQGTTFETDPTLRALLNDKFHTGNHSKWWLWFAPASRFEELHPLGATMDAGQFWAELSDEAKRKRIAGKLAELSAQFDVLIRQSTVAA